MPREIEEQEAIGLRVRRQRLNLGMTQTALAHAVGKTQGWLSSIESGRRELDRTSLISSLAAALHCHPNDLIDRPYGGAPQHAGEWRAAAASILRELRRYDLPPTFHGTPRPADQLWEETAHLHRLRDAASNTGIMQSLPALFQEASALAEEASGHEREEAFAVYAICCKFAHTAAHALGHPELIATSCERASWAARQSGDPLMPAIADWMRVWDMWATADWDDAAALADKALHTIDPLYRHGHPLALRAWGSLQLRAAVSAARATNRNEAQHRLELAAEAAARMTGPTQEPPFDRHSLTFSPGNVHIHGINVALEMSDHPHALHLNAHTDPEHLAALPASRRGHHHMDMARAHLWNGDRTTALEELSRAERTAPQLIRNHPIARATLRRIIYAERASTRQQLRGMSHRFSLDD